MLATAAVEAHCQAVPTNPQEQTMTTKTAFSSKSIYAGLAAEMPGLSKDAETDLYYLADVAQEIARAKEDAQGAAIHLADKMERLQEHLEADMHVNSLGEVQGAGPNVDRACALYEAAISNYKRARYHVLKVGVLHEDAILRFETLTGWAQS